MTIYIDIVLLENLVINYILLLSTAIISKSRIKYISIFISSFVGSIYSVLNYMSKIDSFSNFFIKIIISFFMVMISFPNVKLKKIMKNLMYFYLVSFTFGGISFMLLFLVNPENIKMKNNHFYGTYPIKIAIMGGILGFIIIYIISKMIINRISQKSMICEIEIFYKGNSKRIKTMIDTGNLLKEPITQKDVIIVEKNSLEGIIEDEFFYDIKNIVKGKFLESNNKKYYSYKFNIIPFSSLGNENGILVGFKPDYVKIYEEEEKVINDVFIGIYDGKLTKTSLYTSLIGLNILKEGNYEKKFAKTV